MTRDQFEAARKRLKATLNGVVTRDKRDLDRLIAEVIWLKKRLRRAEDAVEPLVSDIFVGLDSCFRDRVRILPRLDKCLEIQRPEFLAHRDVIEDEVRSVHARAFFIAAIASSRLFVRAIFWNLDRAVFENRRRCARYWP